MGSPEPIHLKPGHLKMAFFTARCPLPVYTVLSLWNFLRRSSVECKLQSEIPFSSANCRAKSHFRCPTLRCPPLGPLENIEKARVIELHRTVNKNCPGLSRESLVILFMCFLLPHKIRAQRAQNLLFDPRPIPGQVCQNV